MTMDSVLLGLVLTIICSHADLSVAYRTRDEIILNKVNDIEPLLLAMSNELERVSASMGLTTLATCHQMEDFRDGTPADLGDSSQQIYVVEARHGWVGGDGYSRRLTIVYWAADLEQAKAEWGRERGNTIHRLNASESENENLPPGLAQTSILLDGSGSGTSVILTLSLNKEVYRLRFFGVERRVDMHVNKTEGCIVFNPRVAQVPEGDVVYEAGRDSMLVLTAPASPSRGADVDIEPTLLDLTTNQWVDYEVIREAQRKMYLNSEEIQYRLPTANLSISGFLRITVADKSKRSYGILHKIERQRFVVLRPSTQTEPFPDDYYGSIPIVYNGYYEYPVRSLNGTAVMPCDYNPYRRERYSCRAECVVIGNDIESLKLSEIDETGNTTDIDGRLDMTEAPYVVSVTPSITITEPTMLQCSYKKKGGQDDFIPIQTFDIRYDYSGHFNYSGTLTEFTSLNDTAVLVKCAASGRPRVNLTLVRRINSTHDVPLPLDEVTSTGDTVQVQSLLRPLYRGADASSDPHALPYPWRVSCLLRQYRGISRDTEFSLRHDYRRLRVQIDRIYNG